MLVIHEYKYKLAHSQVQAVAIISGTYFAIANVLPFIVINRLCQSSFLRLIRIIFMME